MAEQRVIKIYDSVSPMPVLLFMPFVCFGPLLYRSCFSVIVQPNMPEAEATFEIAKEGLLPPTSSSGVTSKGHMARLLPKPSRLILKVFDCRHH